MWWRMSILYPDGSYFFVVHATVLQYWILAVIPGGNWNFSVESSFVYYANTCVFVSACTVSDNIHI